VRLHRYVALGDSISIDLYPALDLAGVGAPQGGARLRPGLGASSLLFRNDDALWPEFTGRDLATRFPRLEFRNEHDLSRPSRYPTDNFATDGATTGDVLTRQLPLVEPSHEETLVTLTAGGNDMLQVLHVARPPAELVTGMVSRLHRILREIKARLPSSLVLVGTVYDPSDGTNDMGTGRLDAAARWLAEYNGAVREAVRTTPGTILADLERHFYGHGVTAPERERWYWRELIVEPNARGASEVRRVWLECLSM
jgi:lysophospholipase L1-like esterase